MSRVISNPELSAKLRKLRGYGLGERNPNTLPGVHKDSEKPWENTAATSYWRMRGRKARANRL